KQAATCRRASLVLWFVAKPVFPNHPADGNCGRNAKSYKSWMEGISIDGPTKLGYYHHRLPPTWPPLTSFVSPLIPLAGGSQAVQLSEIGRYPVDRCRSSPSSVARFASFSSCTARNTATASMPGLTISSASTFAYALRPHPSIARSPSAVAW